MKQLIGEKFIMINEAEGYRLKKEGLFMVEVKAEAYNFTPPLGMSWNGIPTHEVFESFMVSAETETKAKETLLKAAKEMMPPVGYCNVLKKDTYQIC